MYVYVWKCSHVALLVCGDWSAIRSAPFGTSPAQPCGSAFTDMSYVTAGVYYKYIEERISRRLAVAEATLRPLRIPSGYLIDIKVRNLDVC